MLLRAQRPIVNCFLPACSTLSAFTEHKLWRTEGIQDKFVKHHVRPFLVPVSPGDPRLGAKKKKRTEQRRKEEANTNLPQIYVKWRRYFCLKDRQLRKSYLIPAAWGTVGKERYFCDHSSAFPMRLVHTVTTKNQALIIHCNRPQLCCKHYAQ